MRQYNTEQKESVVKKKGKKEKESVIADNILKENSDSEGNCEMEEAEEKKEDSAKVL